MDLETILGVGEKMAAALAEFDNTERALTDGDVVALVWAPRLTEGGMAAIVHGVIRHDHDDPGGFLAIDHASETYRGTLGLLRARAVTTYVEKRLETLFSTGSAPCTEEVRTFAVDVADLDPNLNVLVALSGVESLADPTPHRVRGRCIATADVERYTATKEALSELSTEVAEDGRDIAGLARLYSMVVVLDESFAGIDVNGDVRVLPDAAERTDEVVSERLPAFFVANREAPGATVAVYEVIELDPPYDLVALRDVLSRLADDGIVLGDDEFERLSNVMNDPDTAVSTAESVANDRLRDVIREHDATIKGIDFLSLVEQGAYVDPLLSRELKDESDEALSTARDHPVESPSLRSDKADLTERVFPDDLSFLLGHDEEAVGRLRTELKAARDRHVAKLKTGLAADLDDLRDPVETLVRDTLEFDARLAVSRFACDLDCVFPEFIGATGDDGAGSLAIEAGCSPLLDVDFSDVDPVDYEVSGVTLLSGVNSGGKIPTLNLVGLVVVFAHMGLLAPAESARLSRFSEPHYYAKSQGTLDVGASESTLRDFAAFTDDAADRLVFVDELKSITESGASAKIIAGILEELAEQGVAAVFVSHLADSIREMADAPVAVDSIEAVGLEDGEFVVNCSPVKDHLARSVPELTVEKLAGENETSFYGRLLEKLD